MSAVPARDTGRLFAPPQVRIEERAGAIYVRSPVELAPSGRAVGEYLEAWAARTPEGVFLAERAGAAWRTLTWHDARSQVRRLAGALLEAGLGVERPLAILSENGIDHALMMLAALHVGIPVLPVSPAYALQSRDFAKLRAVIEMTTPGALFVADPARFAPALAAIDALWDGPLYAGPASAAAPRPVITLHELMAREEGAAVATAFAAVGPDTVAKYLLTSGSTGSPKAVVNTQRMLLAGQQARTQVWPFLLEEPPVLVDWLPWNHTFGGNHNFNMVLRHGGTLYIDAGRPLPGLFETTERNLEEIAPTVYLNVPRGYDMLLGALRARPALRERFFSRLEVLFYAAAALPQHVWDGLIEVSSAVRGSAVPMVSSWGSTETAPLATDCHFQADKAGVIGLPVPGVELKLVALHGRQEVRVRGPNVTPGYWRRDDLTRAAFDEEGYYRIGDAVRWNDPARPERGLIFDGRVGEDFKLTTGTWVNVGVLRVKALEAFGSIAQDLVIAGHDRDEIGALVFPNLAACRRLAGDGASALAVAAVLADANVRAELAAGLARLAASQSGASGRIMRALFLEEPPLIDAGEITDKGYINQRAVLERRAALVVQLYEGGGGAAVIRLP